MGVQAKITFTSLNENIFPVRRVITLNSQLSKITIGRASKSSNKSLHSAGDNAWFDSPVMSRDHAEVTIDAGCEKLLLRDVGSMHGTCINKSQLVSYVPTPLYNGDVVVFGAEVKRGSETFPPCKFIVNYEISSHRTGNTFAYPESSDYDDDDDISLIEADLDQDQIMGTPSNRNLLVVDSLPDKKSLFKTSKTLGDTPPSSDNFNDKGATPWTKNVLTEQASENPERIAKYTDKENISSEGSEITSTKNEVEKQNYQITSSTRLRSISGMKENPISETDRTKEKKTTPETSSWPTEDGAGAEIIKNTSEPSNLTTTMSKETYYSTDDESETQNEYRISCSTDEELRVLLDDELISNHGCTSISTYGKSKKRKADQISCSNEEEFYIPAIDSYITRDSLPTLTMKASQKDENSIPNSRSSKRQKIMESLGYVALGGFAAAAGLFSILVATAPEFT